MLACMEVLRAISTDKNPAHGEATAELIDEMRAGRPRWTP